MSSSRDAWNVRPSRQTYTRVSLTITSLWIGAVVLTSVLGSDPNKDLMRVVFAAGGTVLAVALIGMMAWMHFGRSESHPAARSTLRIIRTYVVLGAILTALGMAAIWKVSIEGGNADIRMFTYPFFVILGLWAIAVPWLLRKVHDNARQIEADQGGDGSGA